MPAVFCSSVSFSSALCPCAGTCTLFHVLHARISMTLPALWSPAEARPGNADALRVDLVLPLLEAPAACFKVTGPPNVVMLSSSPLALVDLHADVHALLALLELPLPPVVNTIAPTMQLRSTTRCCSARLAFKFDLACARSCASPSSSRTTHSSLYSSILHAPAGRPSSCSPTSPVLGHSGRGYDALTIRPRASPPTS
eukprot:CAMPEP_0203857374 /NCGR_PEP_ID=MMETSP0359-20131031/10689_1 /ASSEMBLY_ACC=CAM_ASM_000338 /TAXON_ID=268821 /ORGANISM="Scrippsiella Hangoei, Strain SHTV-5" /LENGTH=197 /DNA_ID=CAMNT_0050774059 /DNA_START=338 /DNA_END=928 /DNA_ORIENTATION=+